MPLGQGADGLFKANVPNDPNALPPVLDVEWNGHSQKCPKKLPKAEALAMTQYMLQEMEAYTGKRPIIYTDITFHKDVLEGELEDYPHWLRSTAAEPENRYVNRRWMLWQFTSTGRVPGVRGDVDRNAFYARRPSGPRSWRPTATRATTAACPPPALHRQVGEHRRTGGLAPNGPTSQPGREGAYGGPPP